MLNEVEIPVLPEMKSTEWTEAELDRQNLILSDPENTIVGKGRGREVEIDPADVEIPNLAG